MGKQIRLTDSQALSVEKMCNMELNYKIFESICASEYADEIEALLVLMKTLNKGLYEFYKNAFNSLKDGCFVLESFDEEEKVSVQFHYWIEDGVYFCCSCTESEECTREITEEEYVSALEEYHNV